jgi:hypothetical protein
LTELDVTNPTLLQITKQVLLKKLDKKAMGPHGEPLSPDQESVDLRPFETAMAMNAYC